MHKNIVNWVWNQDKESFETVLWDWIRNLLRRKFILNFLYFATQTRRQELYQQRNEEDKRLEARKKLKENEAKIEATVYQRWITQPVEFATFKNKWIEALYNLSTKALKKKRWIPEHRALADFDTEVELRAKDFVYAITDHNIKQKNLTWKSHLEEELIDNSKATRKTLIEREIIPEKLEKQEDIKMIENRRKKEDDPQKLHNT